MNLRHNPLIAPTFDYIIRDQDRRRARGSKPLTVKEASRVHASEQGSLIPLCQKSRGYSEDEAPFKPSHAGKLSCYRCEKILMLMNAGISPEKLRGALAKAKKPGSNPIDLGGGLVVINTGEQKPIVRADGTMAGNKRAAVVVRAGGIHGSVPDGIVRQPFTDKNSVEVVRLLGVDPDSDAPNRKHPTQKRAGTNHKRTREDAIREGLAGSLRPHKDFGEGTLADFREFRKEDRTVRAPRIDALNTRVQARHAKEKAQAAAKKAAKAAARKAPKAATENTALALRSNRRK